MPRIPEIPREAVVAVLETLDKACPIDAMKPEAGDWQMGLLALSVAAATHSCGADLDLVIENIRKCYRETAPKSPIILP